MGLHVIGLEIYDESRKCISKLSSQYALITISSFVLPKLMHYARRPFSFVIIVLGLANSWWKMALLQANQSFQHTNLENVDHVLFKIKLFFK